MPGIADPWLRSSSNVLRKAGSAWSTLKRLKRDVSRLGFGARSCQKSLDNVMAAESLEAGVAFNVTGSAGRTYGCTSGITNKAPYEWACRETGEGTT